MRRCMCWDVHNSTSHRIHGLIRLGRGGVSRGAQRLSLCPPPPPSSDPAVPAHRGPPSAPPAIPDHQPATGLGGAARSTTQRSPGTSGRAATHPSPRGHVQLPPRSCIRIPRSPSCSYWSARGQSEIPARVCMRPCMCWEARFCRSRHIHRGIRDGWLVKGGGADQSSRPTRLPTRCCSPPRPRVGTLTGSSRTVKLR